MSKLFHTAFWAFVAFGLIIPVQWKRRSFVVIANYACIGVTGSCGLFFLDKAIELASVSLVAPLIYTVPLWTIIQEFFVSGALPQGMALAGALTILVTSGFIFWAVWSGRTRMVSTG